jgi:DNA (cytosine-5)-methyltransferase 1
MAKTVFDLFCGTGGFSYGIEKSGLGFETRFGIDVLPVSVETFRRNHPKAIGVNADVRKVRRADVASQVSLKRDQLDVIVGGPPCQGFSSIRPFRSTNDDDPRNSLFEEYASFVNYFRPKVLIIENVVGLATHKNGTTIETMEECFAGLGYETDWKILNAAHFGVPQKRERLIFIGVQKGMRIVFPEPTHDCDSPTIGYRDSLRLLRPQHSTLFEKFEPLPDSPTVMDAISDLPELESGEEAVRYTLRPRNAYQKSMRDGVRELRLHNATAHSKKMLEIIRHSGKNISCIPKHLISSGFSSCYSRLDGDEPSVTITVNFVHPASNRCIHPTQNRALTPREGARLQSFDDRFEFSGNRSQVVKQIGNAVPPLLGRAIATAIDSMLRS